MSGKMTAADAWLIFGGLLLVIVSGALFVIFPTWKLLDGTSVYRPFWNPPEVVIRKGLNEEELARLEPDDERRLALDDLRKPIVFRPAPSWLGHRKADPNRPPRGRPFPTNKLLYLFLLTTIGYVWAMRRRGFI